MINIDKVKGYLGVAPLLLSTTEDRLKGAISKVQNTCNKSFFAGGGTSSEVEDKDIEGETFSKIILEEEQASKFRVGDYVEILNTDIFDGIFLVKEVEVDGITIDIKVPEGDEYTISVVRLNLPFGKELEWSKVIILLDDQDHIVATKQETTKGFASSPNTHGVEQYIIKAFSQFVEFNNTQILLDRDRWLSPARRRIDRDAPQPATGRRR